MSYVTYIKSGFFRFLYMTHFTGESENLGITRQPQSDTKSLEGFWRTAYLLIILEALRAGFSTNGGRAK